jgi:hypothetical protein
MLPRPHHQWGQEERFPQLPQAFEVPGIAQGLSRYFSQNGSQNVAQIAMMMGPYAGQFLEGVQQGRSEAAKTAKEQLALHIAKLKETQEEEMTRYADVYAAHEAINQTSDPAKMTKLIKGKTLMDDLYNTAVEIGDVGKPGTLGDLIASGAMPSDVHSFLEARDRKTRDVQKLHATVEDDTVEDRRWGLTPEQKPAASDPYSGYQPPGSPAAPTATAAVDPQTGQPAPGAPPEAKPGDKVAGPGAPDTTDPADKPETPVDALATGVVRGVYPDPTTVKMWPKEAREAIIRGNEQVAALDNLKKNPPKGGPDALRAAIKKINPSIASEVDQVVNYDMPSSGGVSGTGGSPGMKGGQFSDMLRDFAKLLDPKWKQDFYQDQHAFRLNNNVQTTLARTKDLAAMADRLNTDLRAVELDLKKRGMSTSDVNMDAIVRNLAGDPKYVPLHTDFLAYNDAYNTIVSGGRHTEGGARLQTDAIPTWAPLSTYRNVIKGHMSGVDAMVEAQRSRWRSIGGKDDNMPSGDDRPSAEAFETIKDYKLMDYVTGARPMKDVVVHNGVKAHWTGKNQIDRNAQENWEPVD